MKKKAILYLLLLFQINLFSQIDTTKINKQFSEMSLQIQNLSDSLAVYKNKIKNYGTLDTSVSLLQEFKESPVSFFIKNGLLPLIFLPIFFWLLKKVKPDWYTVLIQKWIEKYEKTITDFFCFWCCIVFVYKPEKRNEHKHGQSVF